MQAADTPAGAGVGHRLAAARRERGMSVGDVSERTRIRASLIERIEEEDFDACGGAVYARGHVRTIARTVGLDPAVLIEQFDAEHHATTMPLAVASTPITQVRGDYDPLPRRSRRDGFPWVGAAIVSLAAICLIALLAILIPGGSGGSSGTTTVSSSSRTAAPSAPPTHRATPPAAPTTPPPTGVNLKISVARDPSWLMVRDSSRHVLLQQILQPGDERTVSSTDVLTVKVGNAAAVALACNGKDLGFNGTAGAVVTVNVGLGAAGVCQTAAPGSDVALAGVPSGRAQPGGAQPGGAQPGGALVGGAQSGGPSIGGAGGRPAGPPSP
jgi:hypothetical protein